MIVPRDYQEAGVCSLFDYWASASGNPLVAHPTGTGKSLVIALFVLRALQLYPSTRIVVATHTRELVEQDYNQALALCPTLPTGIISSGLRRAEYHAPVAFCGIGSIARKPEKLGPRDLFIVDEAHCVSPKEATTYRRTIARLQKLNPQMKVAGLTATPYRLGQGLLTDGKGIFTDICHDLTGLEEFNKFISDGWLSLLVPRPTKTEMDITGVKVERGDFHLGQLQNAVDKESITNAAVDEMIAHGENRRAWLVFAAGIEHSDHIANRLNECGIDAVSIHTKLPNADSVRNQAIAALKTGELRCIVNNGILTTGFDAKIDLLGIMRHTTSPGLWVQILGRGTRPVYFPAMPTANEAQRLAAIAASWKPDCLVLDFAGNTARLGPINDVRLPKPRKKQAPQDMPAKICPACGVFNHVSARFCIYCKEQFSETVKISAAASQADLVAGMGKPEEPLTTWFTVKAVTYKRHVPWQKLKYGNTSKPDTLRVTYECGLRSFSEYKSFEPESDPVALKIARIWWKERSDEDAPESIAEALEKISNNQLAEPVKIMVWVNTNKPKIVDCSYGNQT